MLTRRTVLGALAAGTLGAFQAEPSPTMFLALNSVLLHDRVKWPAFPRLAAQAGYPGTDIPLAAAMAAGAGSTNQLLSTLKLRPAAIDLPVEFRKDEATFESTLTKLEPAAAFAAQIHCPRMITYIMPSSDTPREELRSLYRKRFQRVARVLAHYGVRLGLEFLGPLEFRKMFRHEFIWRMNDMLAFAEEIGPNVGLLLDSWHWHHAGATTDDILRAGKARIVHVHFNDSPALPAEQIHDNQRLLPGEGVINLPGFLQALRQIGYVDALSVEVFGRLNDVPPEAAAQRGYEASAAVFRKAGIPLL